jgi:hypothetical protein
MDRRTRLMLAALGFLRLEVRPENMPPALLALHRWLDSWVGIGAIERGMYRQGYDLSLTRYASEGWRATFYNSGKEHSLTSATGSAWEPIPWGAVQRAAWEVLTKADVADEEARRASKR